MQQKKSHEAEIYTSTFKKVGFFRAMCLEWVTYGQQNT